MKKFILVAVGYAAPTKKMRDAWTRWFEDIKEHVVDSGNPFGSVVEVTASGVKEQPRDKDAIAGYIVIVAKDMAEARKIAKRCPVVTSMRVYETMSM